MTAKENTEKTAEEEQRKIVAMEAATNLEKTTYNGVTIPEGFAPTKIIGESTVEEGLVIRDSKGNEFVWVEVPKTTEVYSDLNIENFTDENCLQIAKELAVYSGSRLSKNPSSLADHLPPEGEEIPDYKAAYKNMLKSVYQNGGFWIGRYETGIQGTENATTSARNFTDTLIEHPTAGNVAVIKANVQPYTWVRWGQAQSLAQGFSYGETTGSLPIGVQWDLILKFIGKNSNANCSDWGNYRDSVFSLKQGSHYAKHSDYSLSTTWKRYDEDEVGFVEASEKKSQSSDWNGVLCTTGANTEKNSKKNICDIAGNVYEFTIENTSNTDRPCGGRGGSYEVSGVYSARSDFRTTTSFSAPIDGFRVSLY